MSVNEHVQFGIYLNELFNRRQVHSYGNIFDEPDLWGSLYASAWTWFDDHRRAARDADWGGWLVSRRPQMVSRSPPGQLLNSQLSGLEVEDNTICRRFRRSLTTKWRHLHFFNRPTHPKPLTRHNVLMSLLDVLADLRSTVHDKYGITITSATIARPQWMYNELGDLIDEACFRSGIEIWEQSQDRLDMALRMVPQDGYKKALVIQHDYQSMELHEKNLVSNSAEYTTSISAHHLSSSNLLIEIGTHLINKKKYRLSNDIGAVVDNFDARRLLQHILVAKLQIRCTPEGMEYSEDDGVIVPVIVSNWFMGKDFNETLSARELDNIETAWMDNLEKAVMDHMINRSVVQAYQQGMFFQSLCGLPRT